MHMLPHYYNCDHMLILYIAVILTEMLSERPSLRSLCDLIQRVAPYSSAIAIELGLDEYQQLCS